MKYFTRFPKINYSFSNSDIIRMTDIFTRPKIDSLQISGIDLEENKYVVEDGQTPDAISKQFYNNSDLFWLILMSNNILNFYSQWPVSYDLWRKQTSEVNGDYTFYTPYLMDIQKYDLVVKYNKTNKQFDSLNFGVIINVDHFFRSFDVDFVSGEIQENDDYVILRNNGKGYQIIKTPLGTDYQKLIKRSNKMDSIVEFLARYGTNKEDVKVSPYLIFSENRAISQNTENISDTGCLLDQFVKNVLPSSIRSVSFTEDSQKDWIFNKSINIFKLKTPISDLYNTALD